MDRTKTFWQIEQLQARGCRFTMNRCRLTPLHIEAVDDDAAFAENVLAKT